MSDLTQHQQRALDILAEQRGRAAFEWLACKLFPGSSRVCQRKARPVLASLVRRGLAERFENFGTAYRLTVKGRAAYEAPYLPGEIAPQERNPAYIQNRGVAANVIGRCQIEGTQRGFAVYVAARRDQGPKRGRVEKVDLAYVHKYEDALLAAQFVDLQLSGRRSTPSRFTRPGQHDRPILITLRRRRLVARFADQGAV